jgi:hypothetical protein
VHPGGRSQANTPLPPTEGAAEGGGAAEGMMLADGVGAVEGMMVVTCLEGALESVVLG